MHLGPITTTLPPSKYAGTQRCLAEKGSEAVCTVCFAASAAEWRLGTAPMCGRGGGRRGDSNGGSMCCVACGAAVSLSISLRCPVLPQHRTQPSLMGRHVFPIPLSNRFAHNSSATCRWEGNGRTTPAGLDSVPRDQGGCDEERNKWAGGIINHLASCWSTRCRRQRGQPERPQKGALPRKADDFRSHKESAISPTKAREGRC